MNTRSFWLSALIGGLVMAILANLPLLRLFNCFFCMWVWLSGILTVYIYRRMSSANAGLSTSQGAALGAVAGVIGALIGAVFTALFGTMLATIAMPNLGSLGNQEAVRPLMNLVGVAGFSIARMLIDLVFYTAFGAIGGVIATAAVWKTPQVI